MTGAHSAPAGPVRPSIRRTVPVGAHLDAAHRLRLSVPDAVRMRLQHVVEPPVQLRLQPQYAGRQQREHAPGRGRAGGREAAHPRTGRYLARPAAPGTDTAGTGATGRAGRSRTAGARLTTIRAAAEGC